MRTHKSLLVWGILLLSAAFLASCGSDDNTPTNPGDSTAPTIVSTDPVDGATDIALDQDLELVCSEAMKPTTDNRAITLSAGTVTSMHWTDDHTYVVQHTPFPDNTTVQVTAGRYLFDLAGNALELKTWSFSTVHDSIPPNVESFTPTVAQINVDPNTDVNIVFTEAMDPASATGNIILNHGNVTNLIWTNSHTLVVQHDTWPLDTDIIVQVSSGLRDLAGNEMGHPVSWLFTTAVSDNIPPTITAITPPTGSVLPVDTSAITVEFSEPVDTTSVDVSVINAQLMTLISDGADSWSPDGRMWTLPLRTPLPGGVSFHVTIATYRDLAGNSNAGPTTWDATVTGTADDFPVSDSLSYEFAQQSTSDGGPVWDGSWYHHFHAFTWEDAQDFRRLDLDMPSDTPTDWDYMTKTPSRIHFRGFREHDEEGGTDNDFMFNPFVDYMHLPIVEDESWGGSSIISTLDGDVDLHYNVEVFTGTSEVDIPDGLMGKRAPSPDGMRVYWSDCRTLRLYHDMMAGTDTLEVGVDTLLVAPGIGIVQERSYNQDFSDDSWSWDNDILLSIQPLATKRD